MQNLKKLSLFLLSSILWGACSNNNAAVNAAGSSTADASGAGGGSGADMYYEYMTTMTGNKLNINGYTKLYVSAAGNLRSEMGMTNPALKKDKSAPAVIIASKDKPNQSISIDDDTKTYTLNMMDTASSSSSDDPFKLESVVTKAGEETIMGFHCVHARVISTKHMGLLGAQTDTLDLWYSPDVPLAPFFRHYLDAYQYRSWSSLMTPAAASQLQQMGCTGFMVKMTSGLKDAGVHMELTKVRKDDFPKSMFEIPAGYKENKD
jgi:hypothetical protein